MAGLEQSVFSGRSSRRRGWAALEDRDATGHASGQLNGGWHVQVQCGVDEVRGQAGGDEDVF
jgi:hypothetical protein